MDELALLVNIEIKWTGRCVGEISSNLWKQSAVRSLKVQRRNGTGEKHGDLRSWL